MMFLSYHTGLVQPKVIGLAVHMYMAVLCSMNCILYNYDCIIQYMDC